MTFAKLAWQIISHKRSFILFPSQKPDLPRNGSILGLGRPLLPTGVQPDRRGVPGSSSDHGRRLRPLPAHPQGPLRRLGYPTAAHSGKVRREQVARLGLQERQRVSILLLV